VTFEYSLLLTVFEGFYFFEMTKEEENEKKRSQRMRIFTIVSNGILGQK